LAVKIVRQAEQKLPSWGAPSSAAAFLPGSEKSSRPPSAAAGIVERLQSIGYEVHRTLGDCFPRLFADDEEHKRARNIPENRRLPPRP